MVPHGYKVAIPAWLRRGKNSLWLMFSASVVLLCFVLYQVTFEKQNSERRRWEPKTSGTSSLGMRMVSDLEFETKKSEYDYTLIEESQNQNGSLIRLLPMVHTCDVSQILASLVTWKDLDRYTKCQRIFYNKMPKCGSRTVLKTFEKLGKIHHFKVQNWVDEHRYFYNSSEQHAFLRRYKRLEAPFLLAKHQHFFNFSSQGLQPPMYVNVIRDPVERLISHYYYNKYGNRNRPLTEIREIYNQTLDECVARDAGACMDVHQFLPYLCGQSPICRERTAEAAALAKRTFLTSFLAVGLTEDLPAFMEVLEILAPQFFDNAAQVFVSTEKRLGKRYETYKKPDTSPKTIAALKEHLYYEYDVYNFVKQNFYSLLHKLRTLRKQRDSESNRRKYVDGTDESDYQSEMQSKIDMAFNKS